MLSMVSTARAEADLVFFGLSAGAELEEEGAEARLVTFSAVWPARPALFQISVS